MTFASSVMRTMVVLRLWCVRMAVAVISATRLLSINFPFRLQCVGVAVFTLYFKPLLTNLISKGCLLVEVLSHREFLVQ